ncbi:MAG: hypothetical protein A4E55_02378 [Pelotomaculum sp. PtaU1.Bin035]|nr:MAG: hypothetical protein A4E55_02378 [Pelotomaculum sp. PtaU1.Bin035]
MAKKKKRYAALKHFLRPGDVVEVRVFKNGKSYASGYFDNRKELIRSVKRRFVDDKEFSGIYITMNPVVPALLARGKNKIRAYPEKTTSDDEVASCRYLMIDIDAVRPAQISSSDAEKMSAKKLAVEIMKFLSGLGWGEPIFCDTGNGYQIFYRVDLPNNKASVALLARILKALDLRFSNEKAQVDTSTYNPSRLTRLFGTYNRKGESTDDRPHRLSRLVSCPKRLKKVPAEKLEEVAAMGMEVENPRKKKVDIKAQPFDLEAWMVKHGIEWKTKGTWKGNNLKYVLKQCPWNPEHTNGSAVIIQFDNGGIFAKCHHNSCSQEDWHSLRKKYEPEYNEKSDGKDDETQADVLLSIAGDATFFRSELDEAYGAFNVNGHKEVCRLKDKRFKNWLIYEFFKKKNKTPCKDSINQVIGFFESKATFDGEETQLSTRLARLGGAIYYDLADEDWRAVRVTAKGVKVLEKPPTIFYRTKNQKAQVLPALGNELDLIFRHIKLKNKGQRLIVKVYLVVSLVPDISRPILVVHGEKGAAKSTMLRMIRALVDPARKDLYTMPRSIQELALQLANNQMPTYDNLDHLTAAQSDLLCTAVTGGGMSKRTLFSDDDETILSFKRVVALNGINVVVHRSDILDRSILIEMKRIKPKDMKTENQVWEDFEKDRPKIFGAMLETLSKAMALYPKLELKELPRMAEFAKWGCAVAKAIGHTSEEFMDAYNANIKKAAEECLNANPVGTAVMAFMQKQKHWKGMVTELHEQLESIALSEKMDIRAKNWPKAPHILSRRLREIKADLKSKGITFASQHGKNGTTITLKNKRLAKAKKKDKDKSLPTNGN